MEEPQITVGILSGKEIEFSFPESFTTPDGTKVSGAQKAVYQKEKIYWSGKEYDELIFYPQPNAGIFFELKDVTIGINFHWERKEVQRFQGALKIIVEGENVSHKNLISIKNPFHKGSGTKGTKVRTARKCASDKTSRTAFWSRVHGFHCNIT